VADVAGQGAAGEVVGLLGHNGAGKTTTVRVLTGILASDAGTVRVLGLDPLVDGPAVRRATGVVTATPAVDARLTARQNLRFVGDVFGVDPLRRGERAAQLFQRLGLAERADERVGGFSSGMRQRLALARALLPTRPCWSWTSRRQPQSQRRPSRSAAITTAPRERRGPHPRGGSVSRTRLGERL
jgi:ABC-type multidrug transport system ATPase subunit